MESPQVYTVLIRLPPDSAEDATPSIKMIQDDVPMSQLLDGQGLAVLGQADRHREGGRDGHGRERDSYYSAVRRPSHIPDVRMPLNAKTVPKQLGASSGCVSCRIVVKL